MDGVVTKIEEIEDEHTEIKAPPLRSASPNPTTVKRGRGRPRKHPLPSPQESKVSKGARSKTGCLTCRRRKKKCDETKPECNNCVKNSLFCEGYPEKVHWKSGKQKAEDHLYRSLSYDILGRSGSPAMISADLPCLIDGVETPEDRLLLDHFVYDVSRVLTLVNDETNPFQELILPMAVQHRGLMHSLLCLSGAHLARKNRDPKYKVAQHYHFGKAVHSMTDERPIANDPAIAQMLIFCLRSICLGETDGGYRPHMDAAKALLHQCQPHTPLGKFLFEFFMYHDVANSLTSLDRRPIQWMEDWKLPGFILQPEAGALLGVLDGLFAYISKITLLRDTVRERKKRKIHPTVDYEMLSTAVAIDSEIRIWVPPQHPNTHRYVAAQLYRQSTWVYLYRTIQPSQPGHKIKRAVEEGLQLLRMLPQDSATQSVLLMPLFILGCAAFEPSQRPEIQDRFKSLYEYSGLGNILAANEAVEKVWQLMDVKDENSWDWETILQNMGYDFLVT
ncbi:fungal-specific transcription factor domain-containing protein [Kalaharituber pfeilii]|nr:fungal-specific transcription factor domain-containing protein [Kalaharituber pfeilii]